ncbi:hypothetical protein [Amycolatopsis sp. cmx-8-4]
MTDPVQAIELATEREDLEELRRLAAEAVVPRPRCCFFTPRRPTLTAS